MPRTFRALCDERHSAIEDEVTVLLDFIRMIGCEDVLVDFASEYWLLSSRKPLTLTTTCESVST